MSSQLQRVAERDGWRCWVCGNDVDPSGPAGSAHAASVDHVVPRALGGKTETDNLRLAHRRCNTQRGSKLPELQWPQGLAFVDAPPLWPVLERMTRRNARSGSTRLTSEMIAVLADLADAESASSWAVSTATTITGRGWSSEVVPLGPAWGVRLAPA